MGEDLADGQDGEPGELETAGEDLADGPDGEPGELATAGQAVREAGLPASPAGGGCAERVRCDALVGEALELNRGRVYRAILIRPGEWAGKGIRCPADVLREAAGKFDGLASFLNPPAPQPGQHGHPGLERLLGMTEHARWDEAVRPLVEGAEPGAVVADYVLADTDVANGFRRLVDGWLRAKAAGHAVPAIGLSAVPWVRLGPADASGMREVREIVRVDQVDAVYRPAAGGEFLQILAAASTLPGAADPQTSGEGEGMNEQQEATGAEGTAETGGPGAGEQATSAPAPASAPPSAAHEAAVPLSEGVAPAMRAPEGAAGTGRPIPSPEATQPPDEMYKMVGAMRFSLLETRLAVSGLPDRWRRVVRETLPPAWTVDDLDGSIRRVKAACAEDEASRTVQGIRPVVSGMITGYEQLEEALVALLEGRATKNGVRPLSGIREAYLLLSGDYEMTGLFHADRVLLANVNSTTMASIVANVLNKVVVNEFQTYPRWWTPLVRKETFSTLQQVKWITMGGVGELPVVAEGAAYTELTWKDAAEAANWQKRGGYLGITLEAMDKDDVNRLRNAPRALAQAAWLTLGKSIAGIFTDASGVGPTLADGTALFHADHANLGTTPLSNASWSAAKLAMRKQAELGSAERLGGLTVPRFLLVPPDLEGTALTVLGSEGLPGTANNDVNPEAEGNTHDARLAAAARRIIVVDLWTDTNNWAAVADPRMYPTIGLGYRYGETPEIFSVASPNSGLMFSNDYMPIKVRWFYAVGPMDYRGLYKANVA